MAGNTLAALISVGCVLLWRSWGVLLAAKPSFVLMPVLAGSLLLVPLAVAFSHLIPAIRPYPHHWL